MKEIKYIQENIKTYINTYILLISAIILIPSITGNYHGASRYIAVLIIGIAFFSRKIPILLVILYGIIIGSELLSFGLILLALMLLVVKQLKENIILVTKKESILLIIILLYSMVLGISHATVINAILYFTYGLVVFIFYKYCNNQFTDKELYINLMYISILEVISNICILLRTGKVPGDYYLGTFANAHFYTVVMLFILIFLYRYNRTQISGGMHICVKMHICLIMYSIYLASAKHVYIAIVIGILLYYIGSIYSKRRFITAGIFLFTTMYIGVLMINIPAVETMIYKSSTYIGTYLYNDDYNFKYQYYEGTLTEEIVGPHLFTGYGIGQYGSRIANMLGYESMFKTESTLNSVIEKTFPSAMIPEYEKYASLYSDSVGENIRWRSAILTYPFCSLLSIIGELGLLGYFVFLLIAEKISKRSYCNILMYIFMGLILFDVYMDHITVIATLLLILSSSRTTTDKNVMYSRKKIVCCFDAYEILGGAERRISRILQGISDQNYDVTIIINAVGDEEYIKKQYEAFLSVDSKVNIYVTQRKCLKTMLYMARNNFDIMYYWDRSKDQIPYLLGGVLSGSKKIWVICDYNIAYNRYTGIVRRIFIKCCGAMSNCIDTLYPSSLEVQKKKFKSKKMTITPMPFTDSTLFYPGRKKKQICFICRLTEGKGVELLLDAIMHCKNILEEKEYQLILAGDGNKREWVEQFIQENNLEHLIKLVGYISPETVLRESELFLSLQSFENYPSQSLIEAISCGCYIITVNVGDTNKIARREFTTLVSYESKQVSDAIVEYITLKKDKKDSANRDAVNFAKQNFNIEKSIVHYIDIMQSI